MSQLPYDPMTPKLPYKPSTQPNRQMDPIVAAANRTGFDKPTQQKFIDVGHREQDAQNWEAAHPSGDRPNRKLDNKGPNRPLKK